jgi:lambda family phage portal protein
MDGAPSARAAFGKLSPKTLLLGAAEFAFASSPCGVPNRCAVFFGDFTMFTRIRAFFSGLTESASYGDRNSTYSTAYRGASLAHQETFAWRPPFTSGDSATLWERQLTAARADDLVRNDPHAVAGVNRLVDMLVGAGLRLSPSPSARALGLDPANGADRESIKQLSASLKSEWSLFAEDPRRFNDAQRRMSMNGQFRLMARTMARRGEATAFLTWRRDENARYATCLRTVDPDRLCNPMGQADTIQLRGGIEFDDHGSPVAYHVRNGHPADYFAYAQTLQWERILRCTSWGRPVFIHAYEPDREDQSRAISPFASLMTRLRMIGKFADTELASATVNALFAAFVTSNMPVDQATQAFTPSQMTYADKRMDYYTAAPPTLNGVRIPVLPVGDEIKINSSPRQSTAFVNFQSAFLQSIASALGISYEQLTMDWSKTNYSSARAALNEVWRHTQTALATFVEQVVTPIYYAQVEEAFDRGYVVAPKGAPDFWDAPGAYLNARWIGPARGYVDPTKEAEAAGLRMANFTSTLEQEAADCGRDYEEVLDQVAVEEAALKARGLTRIIAAPGRIANDPNDADGNTSPAAPPEEKTA